MSSEPSGPRRKAARRAARQAERRRAMWRRRALIVAVAALGLGAVLVFALGSGDEPPAPAAAVTIVGDEFAFRPDPALLLAGDVSIMFENRGQVGHELVILEQGVEISRAEQFREDMRLAGLPSLAKNTGATLEATLEPGRYQIVCLLPGHLESGMAGELIVS